MATAKARTGVQVRKAHPHVGAEVSGVDLRRPLDDQTFAAVRQAFLDHSVLIFRDQDIDDEQQIAFSERFGALEPISFSVAAQHPFVYALSNVGDDGRVVEADSERHTFLVGNSRWHTDSSFKAVPAKASLLSAREVPTRAAADTLFASMRVAYEALPEPEKRRLAGLKGRHSYGYTLTHFGKHRKAGVKDEEMSTVPPVEHPLVRTHPDTGKKTLFVSGHIESIVGMPVDEGRALIEELIAWCTRPECVYTHKWRCHDLVMWDNRCALHRATVIPTDEPRVMHRTTIAGEGPVA